MEINSSNLIKKDILQVDKLNNVKQENLKKVFKMCDKITVYDNSEYIRECLLVENGDIIWNENIPEWLENIIKYI